MAKGKLMSFEEGMDKFGKQFNLIFGPEIHLNYFMDAICYLTRNFSFDIIKFDKWAERQGYQTERDGALSAWIQKKYGKGARNLINQILGRQK